MVDEALDCDQVGYFGGNVSLEVNAVATNRASDPVRVCLLLSVVGDNSDICWGLVGWNLVFVCWLDS